MNLSLRDQNVIWHPYSQAKTASNPLVIARGEGAYLYTDDNKKLFDGISSWWTNAHGHCHPFIQKAIAEQMQELEHVIFATFTHKPAIALAEHLIKIAPPDLAWVFYSDNGSTAVEVALKMAYQYWHNKKEHRPLFIALEHSYHGDTFGAMSVSERGVFTKPFWPLLFNILTTNCPSTSEITPYENEEAITAKALDHLAILLEKNAPHIAGIIVEPMVQAAGGMRFFTKGFLSGIKELCIKHKILLIADEVATGFYRTGTMFACEHEDISPDIMCLSKAITGGFLPLAVTLATKEIYQAFLSDKKEEALLHGHSFTANPLGCAAAIASLELFAQEETKSRIKTLCQTLLYGTKLFTNLPHVHNVRVLGTIFALELSSSQTGYLSSAARLAAEYCLSQGLFVRPLGNVIYLMPPLCTTADEILWALKIIYEAISLK